MRKILHPSLAIAAVAVLCLAGAAIANTELEMSSGFVVVTGSDTLVIETNDGRQTFDLAESTLVPADLDDGDFVLVRVTEPGSRQAEQIIVVDERLEVVAELDEVERAVVGTVTATSTDQLLVETPSGGQAFVIDPEKLFPPLPEPNQRIVVTYRTLEIHPPMHMATGLILLPVDFQLTAGNVRETSEPIQVAQVTPPPPPPTVKPTPEPAPVKVLTPVAPAAEIETEAPAAAGPLPGEPVGRLSIPRLALDVVALEGVDRDTLQRGAGHFPGTALPGQGANASFAGHRDSFFRALREVRSGDEVRIEAPGGGDYRYRVTETRVVGPSEVGVIDSLGGSHLTLVTCYPFGWIGPAPRRFVVRGVLVES